jgi:hypothetical protein
VDHEADLGRRQARVAQQPRDAAEHRLLGAIGCGQDLGRGLPAVGFDHEVGERAADVDGKPRFCPLQW